MKLVIAMIRIIFVILDMQQYRLYSIARQTIIYIIIIKFFNIYYI